MEQKIFPGGGPKQPLEGTFVVESYEASVGMAVTEAGMRDIPVLILKLQGRPHGVVAGPMNEIRLTIHEDITKNLAEALGRAKEVMPQIAAGEFD